MASGIDHTVIAGVSSNNPYPVKPAGFLVGSFMALALYGVHLAQVNKYFSIYRKDQLGAKLLVLWIATLSSAQILIIVASAYHYFVNGLDDRQLWGAFWWPLSVQDGLIPIMAYTGQLYFGRRAWLMLGRPRGFMHGVVVVATVTLASGVALAITARIWANDPWVSVLSFDSRSIGIPSQVVAILWMGLSALTDGTITIVLVYRFLHVKSPRASGTLIRRMVALTLETVLLTHVAGAVLCILFLISPAAHRTDKDAFWGVLEIVTELYALSMLFTMNSRAAARRLLRGPPSTKSTTAEELETQSGSSGEPAEKVPSVPLDIEGTALDRLVEGYKGETPFGVNIAHLPLHPTRAPPSSQFAIHSQFAIEDHSHASADFGGSGTTGSTPIMSPPLVTPLGNGCFRFDDAEWSGSSGSKHNDSDDSRHDSPR